MKKILSTAQMRQADAYYVEQAGHSSIGLIENAAEAFCERFVDLVPDKQTELLILCGQGNNGADGLVIARILFHLGYLHIQVWVFSLFNKVSPLFELAIERLQQISIPIHFVHEGDTLPSISQRVLVDAILGSGLNRGVEAELLSHIQSINAQKKYVIAVDIPSGLDEQGRQKRRDAVLKAEDVICFQRPKLVFFLPDSITYLQRFHVVTIGLSDTYMDQMESTLYFIEEADIRKIYRNRMNFTHKGSYGHTLVVAGGAGKLGAGILCAEACVYSGSGLTTLDIETDAAVLSARLPEVMTVNLNEDQQNLDVYSSFAVGPGLGTRTGKLMQILPFQTKPIVLDADALSYLSQHPDLLEKMGGQVVLTPHMKEFDRLFGECSSWLERLEKSRRMARRYGLHIVLKNQYTFIVLPDGCVYINSTGNPAMSSGGMGDVLTGMIAAFLAQGYTPKEAALLGVYLHGKAGDQLNQQGMEVIPASRLIAQIPYAMKFLSSL